MLKAKKLNTYATFGSSLKGYVTISKSKLRELFGKPSRVGSSDGKTDEEYVLDIDGAEVRIYAHLTGYKRVPMHFNDWHVGGHNTSVIQLVSNYLKEQGVSNRIDTTDMFDIIETEA